MKAKKNTRQRSEQIQQVSAGLRELLGISQWRKEHPKATWVEIEAAIDEQINQVRAQLIEYVMQMGDVTVTATSAAHAPAASQEPATAGACLVVPRCLGSTALSAVSSACC